MKRSPWRYLWKSEDIRKKLLITLGIAYLCTVLRQTSRFPGSTAR